MGERSVRRPFSRFQPALFGRVVGVGAFSLSQGVVRFFSSFQEALLTGQGSIGNRRDDRGRWMDGSKGTMDGRK